MKPFNEFQARVMKLLPHLRRQGKPLPLVFIGEAGVGKTYIAKWIANQLFKAEKIIEWELVQFPFLSDNEIFKNLLAKSSNELVIVDEIRQPFLSSEKAKQNLEILINEWYERGVPYILIFNSERDLQVSFSEVFKSKVASTSIVVKAEKGERNPRLKQKELKDKRFRV